MPRIDQIRRVATWQNVEWYWSAKEIYQLLQNLKNTPALDGTSEPLLNVLNFKKIGYKGGSEYGVLNLSAIGITEEGKKVSIVISVNGEKEQSTENISLIFANLFKAATRTR